MEYSKESMNMGLTLLYLKELLIFVHFCSFGILLSVLYFSACLLPASIFPLKLLFGENIGLCASSVQTVTFLEVTNMKLIFLICL